MTSNVIIEYTVDAGIADGILLPATELDIPRPSAFPLGRLVITANADDRLTIPDVNEALARHARGDWGEVSGNDARANRDALKHGDRLLSVYRCGGQAFWIITEADRSVTTILMPEDY